MAPKLCVKWESFGKNGIQITAATVFKLAMDGGWKPPRSFYHLLLKHILPPLGKKRGLTIAPLPQWKVRKT
jgi:hypothetical protein